MSSPDVHNSGLGITTLTCHESIKLSACWSRFTLIWMTSAEYGATGCSSSSDGILEGLQRHLLPVNSLHAMHWLLAAEACWVLCCICCGRHWSQGPKWQPRHEDVLPLEGAAQRAHLVDGLPALQRGPPGRLISSCSGLWSRGLWRWHLLHAGGGACSACEDLVWARRAVGGFQPGLFTRQGCGMLPLCPHICEQR